jgi:hypothetical protein
MFILGMEQSSDVTLDQDRLLDFQLDDFQIVTFNI